ncbi:MAG: tetratricopeptide repeat protein [Bacteroidales bacterium]|nr:tetratricopeptide repeat protein [Bacteroidales bacterium]
MKKIILFTLFTVSLGLYITWAQPANIQDNPKYGTDSASRMNCANNLSTMSEFMKIDLLDHAFPSWQIVFNECPASSKNIYLYGIKIYRTRVARQQDPAQKATALDTLMLIYDRRIEYFGQEGLVLGRKGLDLLRNDNSQVQRAYEYLKESANLGKGKTEDAVLLALMQTSNVLFKQDQMDGRELIDNYLFSTDILNARMKTASNVSRAETCMKNIEAIFANSGAADCETLVEIFTPKFEETPEDLEFLKKLTSLLADQDCEETELFASASENLYKIEPSSQAAYNLAKLFYKNEDYDKSIGYYQEAINGDADAEQKAQYHYELGLILFSKYDDLANARSNARKAIENKPGWGDPYILIGNLYASSSDNCGENDFEKMTVFWAAVDKFQQAKSVDPECGSEANELIAKYKAYFPNVEDAFFYGHEAGKEYTVGCWINERTTVRTRQ